MERFGSELRREREARGLSVERVSELTKVSLRNLQALEAGEVGKLPGGVFRRGIVRSYVGALGLDEAAWLARFEGSYAETGLAAGEGEGWTEFAKNVSRARPAAVKTRGARWLGVTVAVVLLGVLAWLGWSRVARHRAGRARTGQVETMRGARGAGNRIDKKLAA